MPYHDAQHLIPHDPPDDGTPDDAPEYCADCGEPITPGAPCANCAEQDAEQRRRDARHATSSADDRHDRARAVSRATFDR